MELKWKDIWQSKYKFKDIPHIQAGFNDLSAKEWKILVNTFINLIDINNNSQILDVGCGAGAFSEHITNYKSLSGIDYSTNAINNLKSRITGDFHIGAADNLPFPDNKFDVIISFSVFFYFRSYEYAEICINEMIRTCSKKGKIFIGDINDLDKKDIYYKIRSDESKKRLETQKTKGAAREHLFYPKSFFYDLGEKNNMNIEIFDEEKLGIDFYSSSLYRYSVVYKLNK